MERNSVKFNELDLEQSRLDDDIEMYEVDMKKKTNNRIM
jgi:hypothetical protein